MLFADFFGHLRCFVAIFWGLIFLGLFLHLCYFNRFFHLSAPIAIGLRVIYPPRLQWQYQGQVVKKTTFDKNVQIGQNIMPLKLPCVKYCRDWLCSGSNRCILRNSRWWGISWQQVSKNQLQGDFWWLVMLFMPLKRMELLNDISGLEN